MRIVHVVEAFGGGVLEMVLALANGLASTHEITLIHGIRKETPANWKERLDPSVQCLYLPELVSSISPLQDFKAVCALRKIFKDLCPDVIHLHSSKAGALGRLAGWSLGRSMNLMYSPHGYAHLALQFSKPKRLIYQAIERLLAVGPCTTVGCGSAEDKEAKRLGASHVLIRNAVNPVQESRNKKSSKDPVTIACLGRTSPQKNPVMFDSVAFKVLSKLKTIEQAPEVNFLWIGGGTPEFPWTTAVETGWQDHQSAIRLLAENADIYFSTAVFEGLPLAVLEAMSLGLPLVLSDIPGHRDCVAPSSENGILFDSENTAVTALLNYCLSTKARTEASTNSLAWYSENFELSKMLSQYRLLYQQVALT